MLSLPYKRIFGGKPMSAVKIVFGIVAVLIVLMGAALAGLNLITIDTIVKTSTQTNNIASQQPLTTEIILDAPAIASTETVEVYSSTEYDPSGEMQYLYVQSEHIDGSFAELNEVQERMYDAADNYDKGEYDQLQEKVDTARTDAKESR